MHPRSTPSCTTTPTGLLGTPGAPSNQAGQAAYGQYCHVHEGACTADRSFLPLPGGAVHEDNLRYLSPAFTPSFPFPMPLHCGPLLWLSSIYISFGRSPYYCKSILYLLRRAVNKKAPVPGNGRLIYRYPVAAPRPNAWSTASCLGRLSVRIFSFRPSLGPW